MRANPLIVFFLSHFRFIGILLGVNPNGQIRRFVPKSSLKRLNINMIAMGIHHCGVRSPEAMRGGSFQIDCFFDPIPHFCERTAGNRPFILPTRASDDIPFGQLVRLKSFQKL